VVPCVSPFNVTGKNVGVVSFVDCRFCRTTQQQDTDVNKIQNQLPAILTIFNNNKFNNVNDFNNFQRHNALYSQFVVLYFTLLKQDKYNIHQDILRNNVKKLYLCFYIPVIVNVKIALNSETVNSEVNLSMYP
jgi:hypothetical protein